MATADGIGILMRIRADTRDADSKIKDFKAGLKDIESASKNSLGPLQNLAANIGLTAKEFNNLKTQILGSVAAIGAVTGVAAVAGVGLFRLAQSAAEYGSKLHDAAQQTGITVETLSALKYAAEQSGSSFEAITASVAKFSELLGEAKNGNDKALATLKEYGVTATETEQALAQAIKTIADMTDHDKQAAAAKSLFRERTAEILPVIQSFDGDLTGLIKKLQDMGILMSGANANAADEFGDQMADLDRSLHQVGVTIGQELIPVFKDMAVSITDWLSRNQGEVRSWAKNFDFAIRESIANWHRYVAELEGAGDRVEQILRMTIGLGTGQTIVPGGAFIGYGDREKARQEAIRRSDAFNRGEDPDYPTGARPDVGEAYLPGGKRSSGFGPGDKEAEKAARDAEKAAKDREREREEARKRELAAQKDHIKIMLDAAREGYKAEQDDLEKHYLAREISEEDFRKNTLQNLKDYGSQAKQLLKDQFKLDVQGATATERQNTLDQYKAADAAVNKEIIAEREGALKTIADQTKKINEEAAKDAKQTYDYQVADFESAQKRKLAIALETASQMGISEEDQARKTEEIEQETLAKRLEFLKAYQAKLSAGSPEFIKTEHDVKHLEDEIEIARAKNAKNESERQNHAIEDEQKLREEKLKSWNDYVEQQAQRQKDYDDEQDRQARAARQDRRNRTVGSGDEIGAFDQLQQHFSDEGNTAAIAGLEALQSAFEGLGQAVGEVIQAYVLYGSAGQSVRQVTAQILAGIAQQAAIKAIFELAEGFAALAMSFFGIPNAGPSATAHFAAAAIYGSIAGIAAVAGRAVAGDSFKKQTAASTGKGGASAGAAASQGTGSRSSGESGQIYSQKYGDDATILNVNRNAPEVTHTVKIQLGLDSNGVLNVIHKDVKNNGKTRGLIIDVAAGVA